MFLYDQVSAASVPKWAAFWVALSVGHPIETFVSTPGLARITRRLAVTGRRLKVRSRLDVVENIGFDPLVVPGGDNIPVRQTLCGVKMP